MKNLKKYAVIALAFSLLTGCGANEKAKEQPKDNNVKVESKKDISSNELIKFKDSAGREVEIPKNIKKIAPSGALAEQVLMTIAPDKIVAITKKAKNEKTLKVLHKFLDYPEIGQFYGKEPFNAEALVSSEPELIIDIGEAKKTISEDMDSITQKTGKPTIFIEMNFENSAEVYRELGKILGEEERATRIAEYIDKVNKELNEGMEKIGNKKVSFAYLTGDSGLDSNPKGSFHSQLLDLIGNNVYEKDKKEQSSKGGGNKISQEELIKLNPEVIIFGPNSIYKSVKENPSFKSLNVIKNDRYIETPNVPFNWVGFPPSVNRFMGAQWLCKTLYPETFKFDLQERIKEYFDIFYDYKLTDEEYKEITQNSFFK